jgi:four helix bundle protein
MSIGHGLYHYLLKTFIEKHSLTLSFFHSLIECQSFILTLKNILSFYQSLIQSLIITMEKGDFVEAFKKRTKQFTLRCIRVFQALPKTEEARIIGKQFLRSATSVGANYRAVCRARSQNEFFAKLSITIEETDETIFWMELLIESEIYTEVKMNELMEEGTEIIKVLSTARKSVSK